jgi:hypothetical protein
MKIIGIIIIVVCFILNLFIGLFLFGNSLPETQKNADIIFEEESYDQYGFSLFIPENMISDGPRIESNVLDTFYDDSEEDEFDPVLQVNIYGGVTEGDISTSEEYKKNSEEDFKKNGDPTYEIQYQDGGIKTNTNGVKIYYDIVSLKTEERLINQKIATFYHKGNQIQLFWTDDPAGFITSANDFDKILDYIKIF